MRVMSSLTLDTDVDDRGESGADAVNRLAQVVALVVLLDVGDRQSAVLYFHVGVVRF